MPDLHLVPNIPVHDAGEVVLQWHWVGRFCVSYSVPATLVVTCRYNNVSRSTNKAAFYRQILH